VTVGITSEERQMISGASIALAGGWYERRSVRVTRGTRMFDI